MYKLQSTLMLIKWIALHIHVYIIKVRILILSYSMNTELICDWANENGPSWHK